MHDFNKLEKLMRKLNEFKVGSLELSGVDITLHRHYVISKVQQQIIRLLITTKIGWYTGFDDVGIIFLLEITLSIDTSP